VSKSTSHQAWFPAFTTINPDDARRQIAGMAKDWAANYRQSGSFPEPGLVSVPPDTLVFVESISDLSPGREGVRLYLVASLRSAIQEALGWTDFNQVASVFDAAIRGSCWGALALVVTNRKPGSLAGLRTQIESLMPCWDTLTPLRYVDATIDPVTLDEVVRARFAGLITMWLPKPTGDLPRDLVAALEALEAASPETRLTQAVAWLAQLAATNPRIRHRESLTDPALLHRVLSELEPDEREVIEAGSTSAALTVLYGTDRYLESPG
jgi:hypothetical protein